MINKYVFVFDLDDTLYKEIDFLKSAFKNIASIVDYDNSIQLYKNMLNDYYKRNNVFKKISQSYPEYSLDYLLNLYRSHYPDITLDNDTSKTLQFLRKCGITGLITDGRSSTQRNKIKALGLEDYFDKILISEEIGYSKPDIRLFEQFHKYNSETYYYIANDTNKDFFAPNQLGWNTVCLIDWQNFNIKKQEFDIESNFLPMFKINKLSELKEIIKK